VRQISHETRPAIAAGLFLLRRAPKPSLSLSYHKADNQHADRLISHAIHICDGPTINRSDGYFSCCHDDTLKRLTDSRPPSAIDRPSSGADDRARPAQASDRGADRAASGPLAVWDDSVVLFEAATGVEPTAIGPLSIVAEAMGSRSCGVESARTTGEAHDIAVNGMGMKSP
jgi:hypothetical protein